MTMGWIGIDRRAARSGTGKLLAGHVLFWFAALLIFSGDCSRRPRYIEREEVWSVVRAEAVKHNLDPAFIYAIVAAESSFNAYAKNGDARGLMQLRPAAWEEVSDQPHRRAWRWKENLETGAAYLAHLRDFLVEKERFSYPLLAACYRYGPYRVQAEQFDLNRLPEPRNEVYREIFRGNTFPVRPPS